MKLIENEITSTSTTSADSNYPVTNLADEYPKNLYKAAVGVQTAAITVNLPLGCSGVYICNTNADSGTLTVRETDDTFIESFNLSFGWCTYLGYLTNNQQPATFAQVWQDYTYQTIAHKLEIALTTSEQTLEVGTVRAGITHEFRNPNEGFNEKFNDSSVKKKLSGGQDYVFRRDVLRAYTGNVFADFDADYQALRDFILEFMHVPIAINLFDDYNQGLLFGKLSMPGNTRNTVKINTFNIAIEEVF